MRARALRFLTWSLFSFCGCTHPTDLVIYNAKIWTADPANPEAQCIAIRDGRFKYVGSDVSAAYDAVGRTYLQPGSAPHAAQLSNMRAIDAHGARIIPGLIDSHLHLISGGLQMSRIQLRDVPNREAFVGAIAEWAKKIPKGQWITGGRWSTESWPDPAQPTKEWIDSVTPNHPVLLSRMDGHGALANSVALKIAGIDAKGPPDPPGGQIERDPTTNEPTGIVKDAAIELVGTHIPDASVKELDDALVATMREANRHGITCVHTMSPWRDVAVLDRARKADKLTLRARFYVSEDDWWPFIPKAKAHRDDDRIAIRGFKQFADGSLGSRTAYMTEPYADNPPEKKEWCGLLREVMQTKVGTSDPMAHMPLAALVRAARDAGYAPAIHAIGDQANHLVLCCYIFVIGVEGALGDVLAAGIAESCGMHRVDHRATSRPVEQFFTQIRPRIEHAQHLLPADIPRIARLGVIASMQPYHKADDGRYAEKAIGPERCKTSYAFRSLLDAGAHVAFGSDWPVVSLNPFLGIHAAVTGQTLDGKFFVPEQNITVEEALRAYTSGAAYAAGDEMRLGQIRVGYMADFVIIGQDVLTVDPAFIPQINPTNVFVAGRQVWPGADF